MGQSLYIYNKNAYKEKVFYQGNTHNSSNRHTNLRKRFDESSFMVWNMLSTEIVNNNVKSPNTKKKVSVFQLENGIKRTKRNKHNMVN